MNRCKLTGIIFLAVTTCICQARVAKAEREWSVHLNLLAIQANGEKSLDRPNGKVVSTDIDSGVGVELGMGYKVGRRASLTISYLGGSEHQVTLRQDFPDGTDFQTADVFQFDSLSIGCALDLMPDRELHVFVEPFVAYVRFDDVYLDSAGPPFDQASPLNLDIESQMGFGIAFGVAAPVGDGHWTINANLRLLVAGFDGTTFPNPEFPDTSSSIGLDFNPIMVGVGVGYRFR